MLRPQHVEQKQPYVDDSCKLLLHFNGQSRTQQFIDSSNNPKVVTAYGNACLSNTHYRFGGTSGYFDGTGDYITNYASTDFVFDGDYTISVWVYPTTYANNYGAIWGSYGTNSFYWISGGSSFRYYDGGGYHDLLTSDIPLNQWSHISVIRSGTSSTNTQIYVNGVSKNSWQNTGTVGYSTNIIAIGRNGDSGGYYYSGYIDEFIIWKGIAKPIGELYPQKRPYGYPIGGV